MLTLNNTFLAQNRQKIGFSNLNVPKNCLLLNPVPIRLCHVIYYHGGNKYHCPVRIELMQDWVFRLDTYHNILPIGKRRLSFLDSA